MNRYYFGIRGEKKILILHFLISKQMVVLLLDQPQEMDKVETLGY